MQVNIGKSIALEVDVSALPENVMEHVIYIGLRNILMDAHAGVTSDEPDFMEKSRAVAEKKLAALMAGEVRVAGTREGDPVRAEAIRLATEFLKSALRKAGRKLSNVDAKKLREAAIEYLGRTPELLETARKRVEEAKAIVADVDISSL